MVIPNLCKSKNNYNDYKADGSMFLLYTDHSLGFHAKSLGKNTHL